MPIDFDAIAAAFAAPLDHELRQLQPIFKRLGDVFDDALKDVEERERRMRAYPLLDWHGDALTMTLAPGQLGALALPVTHTGTLGARMLGTVTDAGRAFSAGVGWVATSVEQELIIPRTLQIPAQALDAILASLLRFRTPTAAMFDPRQRSISDLFGELGLAFRAIAADRDAVHTFAHGAVELRGALTRLAGPDDPGAPTLPLSERLQSVGGWILTAVLVLPLGAEAIFARLAPRVSAIKLDLLHTFARFEASGDRFRAAAVDLIADGVSAGAGAERFVQAAGAILPLYTAFAARFTEFWADQVLAGIRGYLTAVSDWVRHYTRWMEIIQLVFDTIMDIDLVPLMVVFLGVPSSLMSLVPGAPRFTLGDLIDTEAEIVTSGPARLALRLWLAGLGGLAGQVPFVGASLANRISGLSDALDIALHPTAVPAETQLPPVAPSFPDIGETLFGGGRAAALGGALRDFGDAARGFIGGTLRTAATTAAGIGEVGAGMARGATSIDIAQRFTAIAGQARATATASVAGPLAEVQSERDRREPSAIVDSFEAAVASGGIGVAAAAVPAYIAEVRRYWEQRQPPTSPHILARHSQIQRVRLPRMIIHAGGRAPNGALADEIALRFRVAVGEAYDTGLVRLGALS